MSMFATGSYSNKPEQAKLFKLLYCYVERIRRRRELI